MVNILFVCTGNICRSPLAEGILKDKLNALHIPGRVDSCGFESFHIGDPPDRRAQLTASRHGLDIAGHRARLFTTGDFDDFDLIYVMDTGHFNNVMKHARNASDRAKVDYMLNVISPWQNLGVKDPWYHDQEAFEEVFLLLDLACDKLAKKLLTDKSRS